MARTGRPAKPLGRTKPAKPGHTSKSLKKSKSSNTSKNGLPHAQLDVYSYDQNDGHSFRKANARIKARDIEPEPRAKGKGRAAADEESEDEIEGLPGFREDGDYSFHESQDEEIDSDMADTSGEDEPEQRQKQSSSKLKKFTRRHSPLNDDIDLNEDLDADANSEDNEEFYMDISSMLDKPSKNEPLSQAQASESASESDSEGSSSGDEESEDHLSLTSDMEDDEDAHSKLAALVDSLPASVKRAAEDDSLSNPLAKKKRKLSSMPEQTETFTENQFASMGVRSAATKLRIEDMLAALPASQSAAFKKSVKPLLSSTVEPTTKSILKHPSALPAPLELRQAAKLSRQAANESLNTQLVTWNDTISQMRGIGTQSSEYGTHRLSLPLAPAGSERSKSSAPLRDSTSTTAELSSKFQPSNEMERSVLGLLDSASLGATKSISALEARAPVLLEDGEQQGNKTRRLERELMFRAERKAKRIAKIKSKTFRRIARKSLAKQNGGVEDLNVDEMSRMDELDGGDRVKEFRERLEVERARERMGLRHAASKGRFGSNSGELLHGLEEDERRIAERERMQKENKLKRRILGQDDADEGDSDALDSAASDSDQDEDAIKAAAFDELASFDLKEAKKAELAANSMKSGLMGMKFMQAGMAREQAKADDLEAQFRRDLEGEDEADVLDQDGVVGNRIESNLGRMIFAPSTTKRSVEIPVNDIEQSPAHEDQVARVVKTDVKESELTRQSENITTVNLPTKQKAETVASTGNPWLQTSTSTKQSRKKNDSTTTLSNAEKVAAKAQKQKNRSSIQRQADLEEQQVEINLKSVLGKPSKNQQKKLKKAASTKEKGASNRDESAFPEANSEEDSEGELATDEPSLVNRNPAFQQRDLVARAFANDNVVSEFQAEKKREIEADASQDVDETIPGWGSWSGKGVKKSKSSKKFIKHVPGIAVEDRKDAGLAHVIINEKRDKKAIKYLAKDLPFPYTSATQHEYALRQPLGPEWQTGSTHRAHTRPQVLTKPGTIIAPVQKK